MAIEHKASPGIQEFLSSCSLEQVAAAGLRAARLGRVSGAAGTVPAGTERWRAHDGDGYVPRAVQTGEHVTAAAVALERRCSNLAATHPCYDERARRTFGRMHLPVAPRCNLGCGYCERAVGTRASGRGGPGTAARLLGPEEAAARVLEVAAEPWPLRVVGFAGPGEPLANPETFETLRLLRKRDRETLLCLSTNGLLLSDCLPTLMSLGVSALTVTINTADLDTAAAIYHWAEINGVRMVGREAARVILARQWQGTSDAAGAGLLVKVNSVLIPGLTDRHMESVASRAAQIGVWTHNIMPLIPRGRMRDKRRPTPAELEAVRARCERWIPQFRGCAQCTADVIAPPCAGSGEDVD